METDSTVIIFFTIIVICFILYDPIPSKHTKLEESFGGFMNRNLVRFEEKSHHYTLFFMVELLHVKHTLLDNT